MNARPMKSTSISRAILEHELLARMTYFYLEDLVFVSNANIADDIRTDILAITNLRILTLRRDGASFETALRNIRSAEFGEDAALLLELDWGQLKIFGLSAGDQDEVLSALSSQESEVVDGLNERYQLSHRSHLIATAIATEVEIAIEESSAWWCADQDTALRKLEKSDFGVSWRAATKALFGTMPPELDAAAEHLSAQVEHLEHMPKTRARRLLVEAMIRRRSFDLWPNRRVHVLRDDLRSVSGMY